MNIGVFGSREGIPDSIVIDYLEPRFREDVTLISGGAKGVDTAAEVYWRLRGGEVLSLRPVKRPGFWTVERWEIGVQPRVYVMGNELEFEDWQSAIWWRSMLIAAIADQGVAFWDGRSRGTAATIDFFKAERKTCSVHKP